MNQENLGIDPNLQPPKGITNQKNTHWKKDFWELIRFILILLIIIVPFRLYIAQPFIVHGSSMHPTFNGGRDVINGVVVGTSAFGDYLIVDQLTYRFREPQRGEVVIFHNPKDPEQYFIKRIIGLPGETVSIVGNRVTITSDEKEWTLDEKEYLGSPNTINAYTQLNENEYFVMGDNREVSYDSRVWGALKKEMIKGRALLRLFPPQKINILPGNYNFQE